MDAKKLLAGPILAPMVRAGFTSMRLLCADYGASCVFTDVVIASNILQSNIFESSDSILFVRHGNRVLRLMKRDIGKTIVQLAGTNIEVFLKAAEKLFPYCAGVDINCGCTKDWTHACMGAGLLADTRLLLNLSSQLADLCKLHQKSASVKIRLLETPQETEKLLEQLLETGLSFVTVHMRRASEDRETHGARWEEFAGICQRIGRTERLVANGDLADLVAIKKFLGLFKGEKPGVMIARGAVRYPAVFQDINQHWAELHGQQEKGEKLENKAKIDSTLEIIEKLFVYSNTENQEWKLVLKTDDQTAKDNEEYLASDFLNVYKYNEFKTGVMFMLQEQRKVQADMELKEVKERIKQVANIKTFEEFKQNVLESKGQE